MRLPSAGAKTKQWPLGGQSLHTGQSKNVLLLATETTAVVMKTSHTSQQGDYRGLRSSMSFFNSRIE
jgi:hypothetical protein